MIGKIILLVIVVLVLITVIKAAFIYKAPKKDIELMPEETVDEKRVQEHLSKAISIKTISHEDESLTDWNEFEKYHEFWEEAYPNITKKLKREIVGKASVIYTWEGKNKDLDAIGLLAHQDVVPIQDGTLDDWQHPPFEGFNDGEFIWGRGALDMKNHLICVMDAVETLLEEGYQPERTVYLLFGHNEEIVAGTNNGAQMIAQTLKDRGVHLESTLDEGGAIIPAKVKGIIDANLAGIGLAEKGYADFKITVSDKGGHSSTPPNHTAAGKISDVVKDLENHQFKARLLPAVYSMFYNVGKYASLPARLVLCNFPILKPLFVSIMKRIPAAATFVRTTTACTMLEASNASNVLPPKASVTVNFRELPGETIKDTEKHIRKVSRHKDIDVTFIKGKEASKVSSTQSRTYNVLSDLSLQISDKNIVSPYIVMGGTDSYHYEEIADDNYRFAPFTIDASLLLTTHSTNERCPIDQLTEGVIFFKRYIREMTKE